jgi:hypothetical protein
MNISAGYQLQVTSWENDGDNYNTEIISGLTAYDVKFLIDVAKLFRTQYQVKDSKVFGGGGCGNNDWSIDEVVTAVDAVIAKHSYVSDGIKEQWTFDKTDEHYADSYTDMISELVGSSEYCDESNYFRVMESYQVYYYPSDIIDITDKFLN